MSNIIAVLTKIPNVVKELQKIAPNLIFKDVIADSDSTPISKSEIIIADYDLLIPHIKNINNTKWIQGTWAGVDLLIPHFTKEHFDGKIVTRFSGKHFGRLMCEYVIAHIVNYERDIFQTKHNQMNGLWLRTGKILHHRAISDLNIGVLGIGVIGNQIAQKLNDFGAKIYGYGRRDCLPDTAEYKVYREYYTGDTLSVLLDNCDYVINVLPSTSETRGLLNGDMLKNCSRKDTIFINIGRGDIINETDLINALDNKWISHAIIDVFKNEPLCKDSLLWNHEKVFITPHVAGMSRAEDIAEHFKENYELYKNGLAVGPQLKHDKIY